jgi:hypothetical protein
MSDVTRILDAAAHGDAKAADELMPFVYDDLRKLAAHKMALEQPDEAAQALGIPERTARRHSSFARAKDWRSPRPERSADFSPPEHRLRKRPRNFPPRVGSAHVPAG